MRIPRLRADDLAGKTVCPLCYCRVTQQVARQTFAVGGRLAADPVFALILRARFQMPAFGTADGGIGSGPGFGVMPDSGRRRSANHSGPWAAAFRRIAAALPDGADARNGRVGDGSPITGLETKGPHEHPSEPRPLDRQR